MKICRDCATEWEAVPEPKVPVTYRPRSIVEDSGGRCATHWRKERARRKEAAHERRMQKVYGLPPGVYDRVYQHQGGKCALCRRATGATKKLAADHDHQSGLFFGLLCGPCNKDVMGHSRRDIAYFVRCIQYLDNPPARQLRIVAYHEESRECSTCRGMLAGQCRDCGRKEG